MPRYDDSCKKDVESFVALLTSQQARIYSYILSMVPNYNDADDLLQETTKLMWEKYGEFVQGTDFLAWGKRIAHFLILAYYRNKGKENAFCFDHDVLQCLEREYDERKSDLSKEYFRHLRYCVKKLRQEDKKLLKLRYFENLTVRDIALRVGFSVQYIYRNIARVHQLLLSCIQRQIALEE